MSENLTLVEIQAYDKVAGQAVTLRYCDGLAYRLRPSDTPANALYRPLLIDAGWSRVDVYTRPGQYGAVTPGEIVIEDSSGTLGAQLINYAFDGRAVAVRIGTRGAAYPGGLVTVLSGALSGPPTFEWDKITFRPADLSASLRKTLQTARYAGNNALPNGVEGVDDQLGKVKPMVLALASNMAPVLVNSSKLIYQVSIAVGSKAVTVSGARDRAVPLTADAVAYASLAELQDDTKAPAAGKYKVLSNTTDGCFLRLGSKPAGTLTVDAAYGVAADRTHAQVWQRILALAGVSSGAISTADVAALDAALPAEIEYALFDETSADGALTEVAASAGAAWYGDPAGVFRLTQWTAPSGTPVATLTPLRTESMTIADQIGNGDVAPAYRVTLQYGKNWTVQPDSSIGGDKTSATDPVRAPGSRAGMVARAWLQDEYRTVSAQDLSVKTAYLGAVDLKLTSLIASQAAAQAFADTQLALYGVARQLVPMVYDLSPAQINLIRPCSVVQVKQPRWNYNGGRLMRVAGIKVDRGTGQTELTCWG